MTPIHSPPQDMKLFMACSASALVAHRENVRFLQGVTNANGPSPSRWTVRLPSSHCALFFQSIVALPLSCTVQILRGLFSAPSSILPLAHQRCLVVGHYEAPTHRGGHDDHFEDGSQPKLHHHSSSGEEPSYQLLPSLACKSFGHIAARSTLCNKVL